MIDRLKSWLRTLGRGLWSFVTHDKTPLGITLLLTFGAALGTYLVTPSINRTIQKDNARSDHIIKTIDNLNGGMIDLSEVIRKYNYAPGVCKLASDRQSRDAALDRVSAMQWRLIDVSAIALTVGEQQHVTRFSKSLVNLQSALDASCGRSLPPDLLREASVAGYVVLADLYKKAGIHDPQ